MTDPGIVAQVGGWLIFAAFVALIAAATHRHHKHPAPTRPAAQSRVGRGATCNGCDNAAPVVKYHGADYCQRCADEVAALDQAAVNKRIAEMETRWGA